MSELQTERTYQLPGVERWADPKWMTLLNKVLRKLHFPALVKQGFDHRKDMVSLEQIANFELLLTDLIERKTPGDLVELGCYTGSTSAVIAKVLEDLDPARPFHVFDRFDIDLSDVRSVRKVFDERIHRYGLTMPIVHSGDLLENVPAELPATIAFAHIDLGTGGGPESHMKLMMHAFEHVYPRIPSGGIMVLMDYHRSGVTIHGNDSNPGVRAAADLFFRDRPERIRSLYGGACSHAYIRKSCPIP